MSSLIEADHEIEAGNVMLDLVVMYLSEDHEAEFVRVETLEPWTAKRLEAEIFALRILRKGSEHLEAYLGEQCVATTEA